MDELSAEGYESGKYECEYAELESSGLDEEVGDFFVFVSMCV